MKRQRLFLCWLGWKKYMHMATFCALRSSLKLLSQKSKRSGRKCFCHSGSHRHPVLFVVWETQNEQAVAFVWGKRISFYCDSSEKHFIDYKYWLANACTATFIMRICQNMNQIKCKHLEVKKNPNKLGDIIWTLTGMNYFL